jgi:peroxiredoxin
MERLYRKFKDKDFTILAVDIMERPKTVERFVRRYKISFPILLDTSGEISRQYMAISIPVTYIVDKRGKAVGKVLGPRKWDHEHAQAFLRNLLGE